MASGDYEQRKAKCRLKNPCMLIKKLVELIEHPITQSDTKRHLEILNDFLNASHYAFWLQDIPYIIHLYEHIVKKLDTTPEYKTPLECLLHFSALPPMKARVSDQVNYFRDLQEYFSNLGYLILCLHDDHLKKLVLNAIKSLLQPSSPIGHCCISLDLCKEAVEKSELPKILAQLVQVLNEDLYPLLVDVMFLTCQISTLACRKMIEEDAIEYLLRRFEPTWRERDDGVKPNNPSPKETIPIFEDTCCILWYLLNGTDREEAKDKEPSVSAFWSLQYAFRWSNVCTTEKINRNNIAALILKILVTFPNTNFCASGLEDDVIILADAATGGESFTDIKFTEDEKDYQFKKIIWACLHFFQASNNHGILNTFLKNLFQEHKQTKSHIEQYCELSKIILRLIPKFLAYSLKVFLKMNAPANIIELIEGYLLKSYDVEVLEVLMFCLNEILRSGIDDVLMSIRYKNAAATVISICKKILGAPTLNTMYQKILRHCFCILQTLCTSGYLTQSDSIHLCITYLNRVIHANQNDPLIDTRVTICAIHLLWECVLASGKLYREFMKEGGIYIILDTIEASGFPVRSVSLGILADAAQKQSSIPYLITWRKHGLRLVPMLLEIFRNQAEKECSSIEKSEKLSKTNVWLRLCQKQEKSLSDDCISTTELLERCRFRIHGILYALKVKFKDKVELANDHYKLFNEKLNINDEVTLLFADNFQSLLMCQSWQNIAKELGEEGIVPVDSDGDQLVERIKGITQWKLFLRGTIKQIFEKEQQQIRYEELATYQTLKEGRLSDALDALKELRYISQGTERMFQLHKKIMLQQEIDSQGFKNSNYHSTLGSVPFASIYNQTINVQSNIIYEKKEDRCPITPVSSGDDECPESEDSSNTLDEPSINCEPDETSL